MRLSPDELFLVKKGLLPLLSKGSTKARQAVQAIIDRIDKQVADPIFAEISWNRRDAQDMLANDDPPLPPMTDEDADEFLALYEDELEQVTIARGNDFLLDRLRVYDTDILKGRP